MLEEIRRQDACLDLKDLAVDGRDMIGLGLKGKQIGAALEYLLDRVLGGSLPNEKNKLLEAASEYQEEQV